jgi:hypothetical protein
MVCGGENEENMREMAVQYFKNLYTKDPNLNPNEVISLVEPAVSDEMNDELCKDFSYDEIADALFQIGPLKALGPDGSLLDSIIEIGIFLSRRSL